MSVSMDMRNATSVLRRQLAASSAAGSPLWAFEHDDVHGREYSETWAREQDVSPACPNSVQDEVDDGDTYSAEGASTQVILRNGMDVSGALRLLREN